MTIIIVLDVSVLVVGSSRNRPSTRLLFNNYEDERIHVPRALQLNLMELPSLAITS